MKCTTSDSECTKRSTDGLKDDDINDSNDKKHSLISNRLEFDRLHAQSIHDPVEFWQPIVDTFFWKQLPSKKNLALQKFDNRKNRPVINWMSDGCTNICYNCIDRHVKDGFGDIIAFNWEGNEIGNSLSITYKELQDQVGKLSNALIEADVKPDDRVGIYMAMSPEAIISMLAVSRIGAIHVVVFGGYSSDALAKRLIDTKAKLLLAIDGCYRGNKLISIKTIALDAVKLCKDSGHIIQKTIIKKHLARFDAEISQTDKETNVLNESDCSIDFDGFVANSKSYCEPVWRLGDEVLFILHTSGSTGVPKGIVHGTAGYMVYVATTFRYCFDVCNNNDVFFCTGDVGWITGHSYNCYAPLLNKTTFIVFEGIPIFPDPGRYWQICEKYEVTHMYTAPTAIRALIAHGNDFVYNYDMPKLRVLGTVGEPINTSAWQWFNDIVGKNRCSIIDTYFQTETGGHVITNLSNIFPPKPGCAYLPFFGTECAILDKDGNELQGECEGFLVMKQCGPGMMQEIYRRPRDFIEIYFSKFPGYYFTGDGARRDKDGYYWITGRIDDMMNCSGHLLSSAEIESIIASHPDVCECSVIGVPHNLKSETPYAFVVLNHDLSSTKHLNTNDNKHMDKVDILKKYRKNQLTDYRLKELKTELRNIVRTSIGPFAMPENIIICNALPKTRSGKILRRVMRTMTSGGSSFGDLSALTDQSIIDNIYEEMSSDDSNKQMRATKNEHSSLID